MESNVIMYLYFCNRRLLKWNFSSLQEVRHKSFFDRSSISFRFLIMLYYIILVRVLS